MKLLGRLHLGVGERPELVAYGLHGLVLVLYQQGVGGERDAVGRIPFDGMVEDDADNPGENVLIVNPRTG